MKLPRWAVLVLCAGLLATPATPEHTTARPRAPVDVTGSPRFPGFDQVGGAVTALAVRGERAYLALGARVLVFDLSGSVPRRVGQTEILPDVPGALAVDGAVLSVAGRGTGGAGPPYFATFSLSDDGDPTPMALLFMPTGQDVVALAKAAGRVYLVTDAGLEVLDLRDPWRPLRVGGLGLTPPPGWTDDVGGAVVVAGTLAYVARPWGLGIIDVTDAAAPRALRQEPRWGGRALALSQGNLLVARLDGRLEALDLAEPAHPYSLGELDSGLDAQALAADEDRAAIVGDAGQRLVWLSVRKPERMAILAPPIDLAPFPSLQAAVVVTGRRAVVGLGRAGLLSVADAGVASRGPDEALLPPLVRTVNDGATVFGSAGTAGMVAYLPGSEAPKTQVSRMPPGDVGGQPPAELRLLATAPGRLLGGTTDGQLTSWATDDPQSLVGLDAVALPGRSAAAGLATDGDWWYAATAAGHVYRFPTRVARLPAPQLVGAGLGLGGLALAGGTLYGSAPGAPGTGLLRVVRLNDPFGARLVRTVEVASYAPHVVAVGRQLLLSGGSEVSLVDVREPEQPAVLSALPWPDTGAAHVHDGWLLAADATALRIADVSDPRRPVDVRRVPLPWGTTSDDLVADVVLAGDWLVLSRGAAGLFSIRLADVLPAARPPRPVYLPRAARAWPEPVVEPCRPRAYGHSVLLVETSTAMRAPFPPRPDRLTAVQLALLAFLSRIDLAHTRISLGQFDSQATLLVSGSERADLERAVPRLTTRPGQRIDLGLLLATRTLSRYAGNAHGRDRIVVVSGSQPDNFVRQQAVVAGASLRAAGTDLFTVAVGADADRPFLADLAYWPDQQLDPSSPAMLADGLGDLAARPTRCRPGR